MSKTQKCNCCGETKAREDFVLPKPSKSFLEVMIDVSMPTRQQNFPNRIGDDYRLKGYCNMCQAYHLYEKGGKSFTRERQERNNPITAFASGVIDNYVRDTVKEPKEGSLVYCDLAFNTVEHTGIYIGNKQIVHLNGDGLVEIVTPKQFLDRLDGLNTAVSIYTSCKGTEAVGSKEVAKRAKNMVGNKVAYSLFSNNCHKFSSYCLSGDEHNNNTRFGKVVDVAERMLGANEWRVWLF